MTILSRRRERAPVTSREKESGSQAPKREQGTQARAASTPTAETAGAAAAGDVGAAGDASAVAELDNLSARTHAGAPDDVRGATLGKKERERAHARARATSTSTAGSAGTAATSDAGAAGDASAVAELGISALRANASTSGYRGIDLRSGLGLELELARTSAPVALRPR